MIELPEAATLAAQLDDSVRGRRVAEAIAAASPHKFAWFHGDPAAYGPLLRGKTVGRAVNRGGFVAVDLDDARLVVAEGVNLRLHAPGEDRPAKHQLLIEFEDGHALSGCVQMYGGLWACEAGAFANPYFAAAEAAPSPLEEAFDAAHLDRLAAPPPVRRLSVKGFLATEQRVPGLGNGVLQDILFAARLHPRRRVADLTAQDRDALLRAVKGVLAEMTRAGGRDTERDLHGRPGGYRTILSRHTVGRPCPRCGAAIARAQYLGGSVYFCVGCQAL